MPLTYVHELDNQDTYIIVFLLRRSPQLAVELTLVEWGEPLLRTRRMIGLRGVRGKAPTMQLHSNSVSVS